MASSSYYKQLYYYLSDFIRENYDKYGQIEVIDEAYFRQPKEMITALNLLKKILDKCHECKPMDSFFEKLSTSKDVLEFNRVMEKMFGFKTFSLQVQMVPFINAFTYPISFKLDTVISSSTRYIRKTKEGYKFINADYNTMIYVTSGLMCHKEYNERDIMAILLHEIGHNFSFALNKGAGIFGYFGKFSMLLDQLQSYMFSWIYTDEDNELLTKVYYNDPEKTKFYKLVEHLKKKDNMIINLSSIFMKPLSFLIYIGLVGATYGLEYTGIPTILRLLHRNVSPIGLMEQMYGYNDEKIADNFATMYGFGPESAKFEESIFRMNHKGKYKFVNMTIELLAAPIMFIFYSGDPHPENLARILDQINILEIELEKEDVDPKMKKQIKEDIKQCRKYLDKFYKTAEKYGGKFYKDFYKLMEELFGGDWRQLIMKTKNNVYQYDHMRE